MMDMTDATEMVGLPKTPSFRLDGRRAIVAGATSGIGLGCAVALAEAGAATTLVARSEDKLLDIVEQLTVAGYQADHLALDISDVESVQTALAQLPAFHVLVNSAGLARHSPALDTVADDFDAVMNLNVRGAYFLTTAVAKGMKAQNIAGSIVNISSQMAHVGGIDRAVYAASKHAVEGMTKSMAIEWGQDNIRVNTICPTFVRTPLTAATFENPERLAWIESKIKLPRVAEVEDLMGAVTFMASDAAAMITGTSLLVDGGWTAD
jgi:NAD(P)-dependent dehydrogenase (short-subunit alcohol dehydrogenase family)